MGSFESYERFSRLHFTSYIIIMLILTAIAILFIRSYPQYQGSAILSIVIASILVIMAIALAILPILVGSLLITFSIFAIVLSLKYWITAFPLLISTISKILIACLLEGILFIMVIMASYQRPCVEPFLRSYRGRLAPSISELGEPLKGFEKIFIVEILELIIIIALFAIFSPGIAKLLGEAQPGFGLVDLMDINPETRNIALILFASVGIITSIYDQVKYIDIIHDNISNYCYRKYVNTLAIDDCSRCILENLCEKSIPIDDIYSYLDNIYNRCMNRGCTRRLMEGILINILRRRSLINDLLNHYKDYFCVYCEERLCKIIYLAINNVEYNEEVKEALHNTLTTYANICRVDASQCETRTWRLFGTNITMFKIKRTISLLPFIIVPIAIAIL